MTSKRDNTPTPDPTVLTTAALARGLSAERDYVNAQLDVLRERLRGIDRASEVLSETVNRVPTDLQREVGHLRELGDEKFRSIGTQFAERDTRHEQAARDTKTAVDVAFSALKDALHERDASNSRAIAKSEQVTNEAIAKQGELLKTTAEGLSSKVGDLKERVVALESAKRGGREQLGAIYALAGFLLTLVALGGVLAATGAFSGR